MRPDEKRRFSTLFISAINSRVVELAITDASKAPKAGPSRFSGATQQSRRIGEPRPSQARSPRRSRNPREGGIQRGRDAARPNVISRAVSSLTEESLQHERQQEALPMTEQKARRPSAHASMTPPVPPRQ
jgi:hypothetical protein